MAEPAAAASLDPLRLTQLRRVASLAVSPCGTWAAAAVARLDADDAKYVHELWRVDLIDPSKPAVALTRGPTDDRAPHFRADGSLGFLSNRNPRDGKPEDGDDERAQVWILPAGGGEPGPLTDEPLGVKAFRFAERADRLLVIADVLQGVAHDEQRQSAADRKQHGPSALHYSHTPTRFWDHWVPEAAPHLIAYGAEGADRRDLTPSASDEHREAAFDVSADGRYAVITRRRLAPDRMHDQALLLVDLDSGEHQLLGLSPRTELSQPHFSPEGGRIACTRYVRSRHGFGRPELWLFDVRSDDELAVAPEWEGFPRLWGWDRSGSWLIAGADCAGEVPVFRIGAESGRVERVTELSAGGSHDQLTAIPGSDALAGLRHRLLHPPEPFIVPLQPDSTPELVAELSGYTESDGKALASCETFSVPGADGDPVQAYLLRPAVHDRAGPPLPAVLWIHGGPWAQWADAWHWRWNPLVLVSAGYAVVLPNPRGSTGFGQEFLEGVWGKWGAECYADVMAVTDAVARRPEIDGERMAAMGGSFGGYMTNWIGANTDRFRCLVTHASLFWISAFHGSTDIAPFWELQMGTSPHRDPEKFDRFSPHKHIESWKSPTLVIHGERDYRVPISEALALFEALQGRGIESELLVFPDEGHWILRPRNIRVWYRTFLDFIGRHLGK